MSKAFFIMANMNPPTDAWEKLLWEYALKIGKHNSLYIVLSRLVNAMNILMWSEKVMLVKIMTENMPFNNICVIENPKIETKEDIANHLFEYHDSIVWIHDDNRISEANDFKKVIGHKYVGKTVETELMRFNPDILELGKIPRVAVKMVEKGNYDSFLKIMPHSMKQSTIQDIFNRMEIRHKFRLG